MSSISVPGMVFFVGGGFVYNSDEAKTVCIPILSVLFLTFRNWNRRVTEWGRRTKSTPHGVQYKCEIKPWNTVSRNE